MKNSPVSQLITYRSKIRSRHFIPASSVRMNAEIFLIKNETGTFGNPQSRPTSFDLEVIRPEYTYPTGYLGVRAGACIRMNRVYICENFLRSNEPYNNTLLTLKIRFT